MTDILTNILDPEISDQLSIFNAVCNKCSSEAINSYKFFTKSKDNSRQLGRIIDGLIIGTEICQCNSEGSKAGFVSINTENFEYRGYNSSRTSNTSLFAYQKFLTLQHKVKLKHKTAMKTAPLTHYLSDKQTQLLNNHNEPYMSHGTEKGLNIKPQNRATEKSKVLRLRLFRLNPRVLNNHTVFVCPTCDQFFLRYCMHRYYKRKHFCAEDSKVEDFHFVSSPSVIKPNENYIKVSRPADPIIKKEFDSNVLKIEPKENGFIDAFRTYLAENKSTYKESTTYSEAKQLDIIKNK